MTLGRAASLFEIYNPPSGPAAEPPPPTVNAVSCRYCKGKDHKLSDCPKKNPNSNHKRAEKTHSSSSLHSRPAKRQHFPCAICDSLAHLSHLCPRREDSCGHWGRSNFFSDSLIIWTDGATQFWCSCICCDVMPYSILYVCIPFPYLCCCHCWWE